MAIGTPVEIATIANGAPAGTTFNATTTVDAPSGSLIVVVVDCGNNVSFAITDGNSNTYTAGTKINNTGHIQPFWAINNADLPIGSTITLTTGGGPGAVALAAFSTTGIASPTPIDTQAAGATGTGTTPSIATGTLAQASELVLGFIDISSGHGDTFTESSGFTGFTDISASTRDLRVAYQIVAATTTVTYAPTLGTSRNYAGNVLSFAGAASGPSNGIAAITLGAVTSGSAGAVADTGAATVTLGALTLVARDNVIIASAAITLGAVAVSSAGLVLVSAAETTALGALVEATGGATLVTGSANQTLGALTTSSGGAILDTGALTSTLGGISVFASGLNLTARVGTLNATLGGITVTALGRFTITGKSAAQALSVTGLSASQALSLTGKSATSPLTGVVGKTAARDA